MNYYYVNVEDRVTNQCVCVGSMLNVAELRQLISCLKKYNSNDIIITKGIEKL